MMVSAARDHCMFKKYTSLVSKSIMNRLNQMLKHIQFVLAMQVVADWSHCSVFI